MFKQHPLIALPLCVLLSGIVQGGLPLVADDRVATVDVNLDVKHVVRGMSDFGRTRHITLHSNLTESDWHGEADAMNYLMNELDVYLRLSWRTRKTESKVWDRDHSADFFQWDVIWKGFMDACGPNMDFYSIHLYDWSPTGDDPRWHGGKYRSGGHVEAVLEMVEWYQQHRFGKPKPWVISEYGSIPTQVTQTTDYRYADWMHVKTFNQMFLQFLTRPDMVVKSMPFAPLKAKWGATAWPNGKQKRYEASLMQTEHTDVNSPDAEWFFTDKIQWYELWSDVKGTRVDTWSSDPDIQIDAYIDGRHAHVILNNLEWEDTVVDLSVIGADANTVNSVRMKHQYLGEGLSPTNIGRGVLADAVLDAMPEIVTLQPGSTMILDIEYADPIAMTHTSHEHKYYGESLTDAGTAGGAIHRTEPTQNAVTGHVNGVKVPTGVGAGKATITGVTNDGGYKATASVTVTKVAPTGVEVIPAEIEVHTGETAHLCASISPWKASNRAVTWTSSNPAIASVGRTGIVTGLRAGTVTITTTTRDQGLTAASTIRVVPVALEAIEISPARTLVPLGSTLQVNVTFTPENASDRLVGWTSSNKVIGA